jgi:tetratricopeptide (TPR) repeat protein
MMVWPAGAQSLAADRPQQWQSLNAQAKEAYQAGDYSKGIALAEKALALARQAFGDRDPQTLISLNNLASLYKAQGRYGEAEPLYQEATADEARGAWAPRSGHPEKSQQPGPSLPGPGPLRRGGTTASGSTEGEP